jgi:hypothetical protein
MKPVRSLAWCSRHRALTGLASAFIAWPTLANDHIVEINWGSDGTFRHRATVAPGKSIEVCGKLHTGVTIGWEFEAAGPMDFNIHYHLGKDAVVPARLQQVMRAKETLKVSVPQDYCWMWSNKNGAARQVSVSLKR